MSELITVIVPVYNVKKYLRACLDSVCGQSYKNLEIILVDDGSMDESGAICDEYAQKDERIKVIHQKNKGLSAARNAGLDVMTGEYVTLVDSDDFLSGNAIEMLYQILKSEKADIAVCQSVECDKHGQVLKNPPYIDEECFEGVAKMESFLRDNKIHTMACGKLYQAELFDGVRYPVGKYHEDVFTTYLLVHKAKRVVVCPFGGYWYRQHGTSIMHVSFRLHHMDALDGSEQRYEFIAKEYPTLEKLAWSTVAWTAAKCYDRMCRAGYKDKEIEDRIRKVYLKNLPVFLRYSNCSIYSKIFVLMGCVHMRYTGKIYRAAHKILRRMKK